MNERTGKSLRTAAIVFMGLTAAMNLLGGIGTVCAAFLTKRFPPMWAFLDYVWQYRALMIVTIAIGIVCVWATKGLLRGRKDAYRNALVLLIIGTVVSFIQYYASLQIKGKAVPANFKFYTNAITLVLFLVIRLPGIRAWVDFSKPGSGTDRATAGGLAAIVAGFVMLTTEIWVGPSHMFEGTNWVHRLHVPLTVGGSILALGGFALLMRVAFEVLLETAQRRRARVQ